MDGLPLPLQEQISVGGVNAGCEGAGSLDVHTATHRSGPGVLFPLRERWMTFESMWSDAWLRGSYGLLIIPIILPMGREG